MFKKFIYNRLFSIFIIIIFLSLFSNIVFAQQDCPKALTLVKKAHVSAFGREEVKAGLEEALKICPHMVEAIYEFGRFYFQESKYLEAEKKFREADALKPKVEHALGIALSQSARKDYAAAENTYKQALTSYLGHWSLLEGLGVLYFEMNKYAESEELLRQALQSESSIDSIYYNLGLVLERQGRIEEAQISYKTALEKNVKSTPTSIALMRLLQRNGEIPEALNIGQRALLHAPTNENLIFALSDIYFSIEEYSDARRELQKINDPKNKIKKTVNLHLIDLRDKEIEKPFEELQILYHSNPENLDVLRGFGLALIYNKDFKQAETVFQKALTISNNDPVILNNLGTVYESLGQIDKAKDFYIRAQTFGGFKVVQENLERLK